MKKLMLMVLLSGCATIVDNGPEFINFNTSNGEEARVKITSGIGMQYANIPNTVTFPKSSANIIVQTTGDECHNSATTVVPSKLNGWLIGNILFGGVIGLVVDFATGNAYTYPSTAIVNIDAKDCKK
jgi:hypothetical protein